MNEVFKGINSSERKMFEALLELKESYSDDVYLVSLNAKEHGIPVVEGGMFKPMQKGAHNVRSFEGNLAEAKALKRVENLTVLCMDYRQSQEAIEELGVEVGPDKGAVFACAGGAAQPEINRQIVLCGFIDSFHKINPEADINLVAHTGVCGGVKEYPDEDMSKLYEEAPLKEEQRMVDYVVDFARIVVDSGVDSEKIKVYLSQVDTQNTYIGLKPLEFDSSI